MQLFRKKCPNEIDATRKIAYLVILIFSCASALFSCSNGNLARFNIINETDATLDSVCISPDNRCIYFSVDKAGKTNRKIDMSGIVGDGEFVLHYKTGNKKNYKYLAYFSNGSQVVRLTKITIYTDTCLIKHESGIFSF
ncbi:MAG: hypothetical protein JWQ27_347 [Ferruginibacter sp.]|nr:hypothetical protein [Ferruginibacter sp.]